MFSFRLLSYVFSVTRSRRSSAENNVLVDDNDENSKNFEFFLRGTVIISQNGSYFY